MAYFVGLVESAGRGLRQESLASKRELGDAWSTATVLESMACLAQAQRLSERAVKLAGRPGASAPGWAPRAPRPRAGSAERGAHRAGVRRGAGLVDSAEREVVGLLLPGQSNHRIAEGLVVTERTAETHVRRILNKLDLCSRARIAARAREQGLLESRAS